MAKAKAFTPSSIYRRALEYAGSKLNTDPNLIFPNCKYIHEFLRGNSIFGLDNLSRRYQYISETRKELEKQGFNVPPLELYRFYWDGDKIFVSSDVKSISQKDDRETYSKSFPKFPNICITIDLKEDRRFKVVDYEESIARSLINGDELIKQFNRDSERLFSYWKNYRSWCEDKKISGPYLLNDNHAIPGQEEAIRKMFLLQVPVERKEPGKLVLGDLDHVYIFS